MTAEERAGRRFTELVGAKPDLLVRAPGRINLIGDHTDYNGGFVLPMAIDHELAIAARPRPDRIVRVHSETEVDGTEFALDTVARGTGWAEYLKGVAVALGTDRVVGWDGAIASDLAIGAGLSSSAAIELATARIFAELSGLAWDPAEMARIGQQAENEWVGMSSGIMDQLICSTGRAGHARLIDCRDLSGIDVPLIPGVAVILLDTGTRRTLLGSEYNDRRADCEAAAAELGVELLRDARIEDVDSLDGRRRARARHVITENQRTEAAARAMADRDAAALGVLMNASHASLRDDFEVSSPELDAMARTAQAATGCFGARQTGGGFAGSCVALVDDAAVAAFVESVTRDYSAATGKSGSAQVVAAVDGVTVRSLS
ncbi:MAG: galactokinase [Acidimicrobiia bacterium]|nr:galactokinase [Acidimicrobiia bacterium]MBT8192702.1 galactokinase [Acidimicrobiia bacterium]NNJ48561.1 galactokinase [Acidimicrobiia bacterium]NNL14873.1 galactokinase [Acidimicrobiia bacterium]NNL96768.1 galactokinase [Acidimicrobiia bacterium]